jgi:hypothetical protein
MSVRWGIAGRWGDVIPNESAGAATSAEGRALAGDCVPAGDGGIAGGASPSTYIGSVSVDGDLAPPLAKLPPLSPLKGLAAGRGRRRGGRRGAVSMPDRPTKEVGSSGVTSMKKYSSPCSRPDSRYVPGTYLFVARHVRGREAPDSSWSIGPIMQGISSERTTAYTSAKHQKR